MLTKVIRILFISTIPAVMAFISRENGLIDSWHNKKIITFDPTNLKMTLILISILIPSVFFTIYAEYNKSKLDKVVKRRIKLLQYITTVLRFALDDKLKNVNASTLNVRIWTQQQNVWRTKAYFNIKNIEGLSIVGNTDGLKLQVKPKIQGVIGQCYAKKDVVLDEDLSSTDYKLTQSQKNKINGTQFCLAVPLFDNNDKVTSIVSFDSNFKISVPKNQESDIINLTKTYCQTLYESCPDLFK
ncbi:hypothetical protein B1748_17430 [Paenibacillus sp. MY03]|uniref:hypothetical protein n=1 Tax=Paenibacillus sp. MY03 TaxID=302980 RepID=UPI000B3C9AC6|nr:hypothetical protein [Paenibacillus sp. MY03]OUS75274.1 hypothetical protein B1748_17430 [Paenibacillus sp. MY03]